MAGISANPSDFLTNILNTFTLDRMWRLLTVDAIDIGKRTGECGTCT